MPKCKKCGFYKSPPNQKCFCGKVETKVKPKKIKSISDKKRDRLKKEGGEVDIFKKILKKQNMCRNCGKKIENITPSSFAHILPKGKYPQYRLFPNNIALVCGISCHTDFDKKVTEWKKENGLIKLEEIIKNGKEFII